MLTQRAAYHSERAAEKQPIVQQLRDLDAALKAGRAVDPESLAMMNKSMSYHARPEDQADALEIDIRNHRNKALFLKFAAEHIADEDYRLTWNDLERLEVVK